MSSKPDKQPYGENFEDPNENIPGQGRKPEQPGQPGQPQQKEKGTDLGGEQHGGQQR